MQAETLLKIVLDVRRLQSESQIIELKAAQHGCPTRLFDTLSSFSNQDGGGVIIFGVDEADGYNICGVYDPQDLQKKVTEQCKQMEPTVRALFTLCDINGKTVVSAEIPGVDISERPVFYKGVGRIKGSYIRVGESDEPMSEYEIYSYSVPRTREEIVAFIGKTRNYVMSIVSALISDGTLKMTIPEKPKSRNQKYVKA